MIESSATDCDGWQHGQPCESNVTRTGASNNCWRGSGN
jgi:hypothetical protein